MREAADPGAYRQLLMINEYPPSTVAGAPVIARQLLRYYPPEKLDVVCCASWYNRATPTVRETTTRASRRCKAGRGAR